MYMNSQKRNQRCFPIPLDETSREQNGNKRYSCWNSCGCNTPPLEEILSILTEQNEDISINHKNKLDS